MEKEKAREFQKKIKCTLLRNKMIKVSSKFSLTCGLISSDLVYVLEGKERE